MSHAIGVDALRAEELPRTFRRCAQTLDRIPETIAHRLEVTRTEYDVLEFLVNADPTSPTAIGELLDLSKGGTTALIQRLERGGWLTRVPNPDNPRVALATVSDRGRSRLRECREPMMAALDGFVRTRPPQESAAIARFLDALAWFEVPQGEQPERRRSRGTESHVWRPATRISSSERCRRWRRRRRPAVVDSASRGESPSPDRCARPARWLRCSSRAISSVGRRGPRRTLDSRAAPDVPAHLRLHRRWRSSTLVAHARAFIRRASHG
jgi:DNA-binding MarR family transcriptional regulator